MSRIDATEQELRSALRDAMGQLTNAEGEFVEAELDASKANNALTEAEIKLGTARAKYVDAMAMFRTWEQVGAVETSDGPGEADGSGVQALAAPSVGVARARIAEALGTVACPFLDCQWVAGIDNADQAETVVELHVAQFHHAGRS